MELIDLSDRDAKTVSDGEVFQAMLQRAVANVELNAIMGCGVRSC